jgi:bis(5'-nucleosyl)-tetraphosphatase (symmetrical)
MPPQWDLATAATAAREVERALAVDAAALFDNMYGDRPDRWSDSLTGFERLRFIVNCLTRLRYCDAAGRINLRLKEAPDAVREPWMPWFRAPRRRSRELRIVCGHWSTLGLYMKDNVFGIDAGCVWGGNLCALRLDEPGEPILVGCRRYQQPGGD